MFSEFAAQEESVVNISGGAVGAFFEAGRETVVNLSGGSIGTGFQAQAGSEINVTGGSLGSFFGAKRQRSEHLGRCDQERFCRQQW